MIGPFIPLYTFDDDTLYCRCDFGMVMTLLCGHDSAESSSSDEDDLEALMLVLTENRRLF